MPTEADLKIEASKPGFRQVLSRLIRPLAAAVLPVN
jgi:hypothetical protein